MVVQEEYCLHFTEKGDYSNWTSNEGIHGCPLMFCDNVHSVVLLLLTVQLALCFVNITK